MRIILLFFATLLFANERLIISKFDNLQPYYYNHQIVTLKLQTISVKEGELSISDDMNHTYSSIKEKNKYITPIRFQLQDKFPTFQVSLKNFGLVIAELNLTINSKIRHLYPPKDFCGVLADDLNVSDKVLASYDDTKNIVYWTLNGTNANLKDFKLGFDKEKLYLLDTNETSDINNSIKSYSYSALVPSNKRNFKFTYFNLKSQNYKTIKFHINLENEIVSTQTDIRPMAKSNLYMINVLLGVILLLWIVLYIYRRKIIYIILMLIVILIIIFFNMPKKEIILHRGDIIQLLPFKNSTIFMRVAMDMKVKVLMSKDGYKKIEINKHIGWVKDE